MEYFAQQLINGLTLGSIYGLIAIGYTMVFGIIGMVNFAHGDVFMLSTFVALIVLMILTQVIYKKVDLTMLLNGALAGPVSITAGPLDPTLFGALWIGVVRGVIVVIVVPMLRKMKIDDVVGAIPVHLVAGFWGTMAVPFYTEGTSFVTQFIGFAAIGAFMLVASAVLWFILKATMGLRPSQEDEMLGLDKAELGLEAYPEFSKG